MMQAMDMPNIREDEAVTAQITQKPHINLTVLTHKYWRLLTSRSESKNRINVVLWNTQAKLKIMHRMNIWTHINDKHDMQTLLRMKTYVKQYDRAVVSAKYNLCITG